MKIQGTNPYTQTYHKQRQFQKTKERDQQQDQLNISSAAKELQGTNPASSERAQYIEELKQRIQTGRYEVNHEKAAEKMIDFWSKRI